VKYQRSPPKAAPPVDRRIANADEKKKRLIFSSKIAHTQTIEADLIAV
jgi:hypothetical protein